jgi:hypothetical protein
VTTERCDGPDRCRRHIVARDRPGRHANASRSGLTVERDRLRRARAVSSR